MTKQPTFVRNAISKNFQLLAFPAPMGLAGLLMLCLLIFGAGSVLKGIDTNYDLLNYHFYNPWAFFHGRYLIDIAAAKKQSYFNPTFDFLFYALIKHFNDCPRWVAFVMGAIDGVNAFLLIMIARQIFKPALQVSRVAFGTLVVVAVVLGVTGAGFQSELGITMGDLDYSIFILGALWLILKSADDPDRKVPLFAAGIGLLTGLAFALKLVAFVYLLGILSATLVVYRRFWLKACAFLAAGGIAGFFLGGGWFFLLNYQLFGNPTFPMLNNIFRSPFAEPLSYGDSSHFAASVKEWLFYPFLWAYQSTKVAELPFKDPRIAVAITLCAALGIVSLWRVLLHRREAAKWPLLVDERKLLIVLLFCIVSYIAWIAGFAIYRYLLVIEMLAGMLSIAIIACLIGNPRAATLVSLIGAAGCIVATSPLDWGHVPFGSKYIDIQTPSMAPNSVVLLTGYGPPVTHIVPFLRPDARYVHFDYDFLTPTQPNLLAQRGRALVLDKTHPLYILRAADQEPEIRERTLSDIGIKAKEGSCAPVKSNLAGFPVVLCAVERLD